MKTKHKATPLDYPNALLHMGIWGTLSGFILADLYMISVMDFQMGMDSLRVILTLLNPLMLLSALIVGGSMGLILGMAEGLLLAGFLRRRSKAQKVNPAYTRQTARRVYFLLFFMPFFFMPQFIFLGLLERLWAAPFICLIAACASVYAGHRYLERLKRWNAANQNPHIEKAKNFERLEDKLKNDAAYSDEEAQEETARS